MICVQLFQELVSECKILAIARRKIEVAQLALARSRNFSPIFCTLACKEQIGSLTKTTRDFQVQTLSRQRVKSWLRCAKAGIQIRIFLKVKIIFI
jgi:hypothetical protein